MLSRLLPRKKPLRGNARWRGRFPAKLTPAAESALWSLVQYHMAFIDEERKHFELMDDAGQRGHVYLDLVVIHRFLEDLRA